MRTVAGNLRSAALVFFLMPTPAWAQSGFVGVVKDSTGGVLPGVTVEAASPALIEKVRSATTNSEGMYQIADLRPGTYRIAFALPGFNGFVRENVELPAQFTATVNAEMRVGAVEETMTVVGDSPVVDVKTATTSKVLRQETMDNLPVGRAPHNFAALTPGATGTILGDLSSGRFQGQIEFHGSPPAEATISIDGDRISAAMAAGGGNVTTRLNPAMISEITLTTSGGAAEFQGSGIVTNIIPKEGGNTFTGYISGLFSYDGFQTSNVTDALRALGVGAAGVVKQWDFNPAFGGPIIRDRLWFFGSVRKSSIIGTRPGVFEDAIQTDWVYTPDPSKPALSQIDDDDYSSRLTWQATTKDKFQFAAGVQPRADRRKGFEDASLTTEATAYITYRPQLVMQAVWKRPQSDHLLFEVGGNVYDSTLDAQPQPGYPSNLISATESTTGKVIRGNSISNTPVGAQGFTVWAYRGSISYVTGSHNVKVGGISRASNYFQNRYTYGEYNVGLTNGVPVRLTLTAPYIYHAHIKADASLYAQDSWTLKRATFNLGLRYDYLNGWNEPEELPAGRFAPARSFPGTTGTPLWHDISPRAGVAIDVFGNNRTAIKLSLGRYVSSTGTNVIQTYNPVFGSALTATRTWTDSNLDFLPQCDFTNPNPNIECGRLSDLNFGTTNIKLPTQDSSVAQGFDVRPYIWEGAASIQQELVRGLSVTAGYYLRRSYNFSVTDNTLVGPGDYDPYCITAPKDPRLPNGGGYQVCGLADEI